MAYSIVFTPETRTVIALVVNADQVAIIGVFYGGQDYEAALSIDKGLIHNGPPHAYWSSHFDMAMRGMNSKPRRS